jgi:predicted alpha/beta hydrolase family esterase
MREVKRILEEFHPDTVVCHSLANTLWFWLSDEGEIDRVRRLIMVSPPSRYTQEETIKTFFPSPMPKDLYADEIDMVVSDSDPYITIDEAQELSRRYDIPMKILKDAGHINADSGYGRWSYIEDLVMGDRS